MEEDIKLVEQRLDYYEESPEGCNWRVSFEGNEITQLRNLLTRYKQMEAELEKKEAIINEMAEEIASYNRYEAGALDEKEEVIKFYTNKVESRG